MARLFGYFANQSDRIRCAMALEGDALALSSGVRVDGWGVGSYQGSEILLRRKPTELREGVDFRELVRDRRAIAAAVREVVAAMDEITDAAGQARSVLNLVVTNHFAMVALRRGMPMSWVRRNGIRDCAACRKQPDIAGREPKRVDH